MQSYLTWLEAGHSSATVTSYKFALYPFRNWFEALEKSISSLTSEDLIEYMAHLNQRKIKSGTKSIYITALRSFLRFLKLQGKLEIDLDAIPYVRPDDVKSHELLEEDEALRLIHSFDELFPKDVRDKCMMMMLWKTGVRIGELLDIRLESVEFDTMSARIKTYKRKNHFRYIYWDEELNLLLKKWVDMRNASIDRSRGSDSGYLFISLATNSLGEKIQRHGVSGTIRKQREFCGIKKQITPHSFRHGFATYGVRKNVNVRYLQEMLGHAKISTTQIYMRTNDDEIRNEYKKIYGRTKNSHWDT